jgi:hypothetical protein
MKNCATIEERVLTAYHILHVMSPRDISAFWMELSKLVQNRIDRLLRTNEHQHGHINEQLDMILVNRLENIRGYYYRDLATTALGLAKIVKQVGQRESRTKAHTDNPNQVLRDLLIGIDPENKNYIFREIAKI